MENRQIEITLPALFVRFAKRLELRLAGFMRSGTLSPQIGSGIHQMSLPSLGFSVMLMLLSPTKFTVMLIKPA